MYPFIEGTHQFGGDGLCALLTELLQVRGVQLLPHRSHQAGDKECREPVVKPQVVGTIQYIEWLILNDRVQPSLIAAAAVYQYLSGPPKF